MIQSSILIVLLLLASVVDLSERRLPNEITLPLIGLGLCVVGLTAPEDVIIHGVAATSGYLALWLTARLYRHLRGCDGLGLGDAKLLAAAGAWLGPLYLAPVILLSALLALAAALALQLAGRNLSFKSALPFGPFLSCAFICLWFAKLANWSLF